MKNISFIGVVLGLIAGALLAMLSGSWIFWMATGIALGVLVGSASARRTERQNGRASGHWQT
ncbi:MAG TPA: hypothetical protein VFL42_08435 [Terriglobales bacterium]|nr:hypothetical protein [Terriglobales bacterium]